MKPINISGRILTCTFLFLVTSAFYVRNTAVALKFPFKEAGLTERQAAAHLLNRFTYGATPEQVEEVLKMGPEKWFESQLDARNGNDDLDKRLSTYKSLNLSNEEVVNLYPKNTIVAQMAIKEGVLAKDSINKTTDKKAYNALLNDYKIKKGFRPEPELYREFINIHILRAAYSKNQLQEVLTDFWFNHFNISFTKNSAAPFIPAFERDVIRPNVTGKFDKLLLATAKSPAMLYFLDNFISVKASEPKATANNDEMMKTAVPSKKAAIKNNAGLNENYAREVMELHTLGVDGGYTQSDVTEAARILTGWSINPMRDEKKALTPARKVLANADPANMEKKGFVRDGDFLFTPNRHDSGEKVVLGRKFKSNGYQEGVDLLEMLAHHPSTAKFICKKLAVRFVSDNPPATLINKMAATFLDQDGDIRQVLITMVNSPEFWNTAAVRQKTKSPFEYAISAIRGLDADIINPYQLFTWISRMGQRIFYYQAPTGFPDNGQYWINTGSLLNRMNFGLALTAQKIPGIRLNLLAINKFHEPESANAALVSYSKLLMPERDLQKTFEQLTPMIKAPDLSSKVDHAAASTPANGQKDETEKPATAVPDKNAPAKMLAQVVGVVIGSPEFQRR